MKIINALTEYLQGIFETGLGFLHTLLGFIIVRLYYSIPVYLVWTFIIANIYTIPAIPFFAWWAILVAFDCFRFDITKLYTPNVNNEQ